MRFTRQVRIFRGHLDPAPFACVVFLLVMFMQLGSMISTPGVLIQLPGPAGKAKAAAMITVGADGTVRFGTNVFTSANLEALRALLKNSPDGPPFYLATESGASPKLAQQVQEVLGIELPVGPAGLVGSANPRVIVAVNFLGQYFYDNRLIGEADLRKELADRLKAIVGQGKDLDLVISADKQADYNSVNRLYRIAGEVGIKHAYQAERAPSVSTITTNSHS